MHSLPFEKELTLLCGKEVSDIYNNDSGGTGNCDLINGKLGSISGAVQIVSACCWSSTENSDDDRCAFYVDFSDGNVGYNGKGGTYDTYSVRCSFAF